MNTPKEKTRISKASTAVSHPLSKFSFGVFIIFLFSLFLLPFASAALDDAVLYYSFEDMVTAYTNDDSGGGHNGFINNVFDMPTTSSAVGNWATIYAPGNTLRNTSFTNFDEKNTPITFSTWVYVPDPLTGGRSHNIFSFGAQSNGDEGHFAQIRDNKVRYGACYSSSPRRCFRMETINNTVPYDTWTHVAINIRALANNAGLNNMTVWVDGQARGMTVIDNSYNTGLEFYGNEVRLGNITQATLSGNHATIRIDDFGVWNRSLTQGEVTSLYNNGVGFNPYNPNIPQQISAISVINLDTFTDDTINFGDFFSSETYIQINYSYNFANYFVNNSAGFTYIDSGDFAVQAITDTTYKFYAFGNSIPQVPMTLKACNNLGCATTTIFFVIDGIGAPTQIASIADWTIPTENTSSRLFSDYFAGYTRRFFQYNNPDNATQQINVSQGFPHTNSCFTATVIGETLSLTTITNECTLTVRMIVDDTITSAASNDFTLEVQEGFVTEVVGGNFFTTSLFSLYPPAGSLSNRTKLFVVLVHFFIVIAAGLFIGSNGSASQRSWLAVVFSIITIFLILFFTSLGYIPLWIIIILVLIALLVGIATFRGGVVG